MRLLGRSFSMMRAAGLASTAAALVTLLSPSAAHAADYRTKGSLAVATKSIAGVDGLSGKIAYPDLGNTGGIYPVVILAHGFSSSPDNMIGWGEHLASYGFIAVALKNCGSGFVCTPDPNAEADLIKKTLTYVESGIAPEGVTDHADTARLLLLGHSAGGQVMTVAAAALHPTALVLFDPVGGSQSASDAEPGQSALAKVCSPTLTMFAQPHDTGSGPLSAPSCNKKGAWQAFADSSTGPRTSMVVKASTHCDGELPARAACGFACGGGADATRQNTYRHFATAFALATLEDDAEAKAELSIAKINANVTVEKGSVLDGAPCPSTAGGAGGNAGAGGGAEAGAGGAAEAGAAGAETIGGAGGDATAGAAGEGGSGDAGAAGDATAGSAGEAAAGSAGEAAAGASGANAGASGQDTGGAAGAAGGPVSTAGLAVDEGSGCGCRVPGPESRAGEVSGGAFVGLFAAALGLIRARANRRRPR